MKFKVNIISNVATKKFIKSLTKGIKKIKLANIPKTAGKVNLIKIFKFTDECILYMPCAPPTSDIAITRKTA